MAAAETLYAHYDRYFGSTSAKVLVDPSGNEVSVCAYPAAPARSYVTLATIGLSDSALGEDPDRARQELLMYVEPTFALREPGEMTDAEAWPVGLLRTLAGMARTRRVALLPGDSVPNGHPPQPYMRGASLCAALLLPPKVEDVDFDGVMLDGERTRFLWVLPVTAPEYLVKLNSGVNAVLRAMGAANLPLAVDAFRRSVL